MIVEICVRPATAFVPHDPQFPVPPQGALLRAVRRNLLPPLAPPVPAHEDADLGVPAIGKVLVVLQVVAAVVTSLVTRGMASEHVVVDHVAELHGQLLVNFLWLWLGNGVVGHGRDATPRVNKSGIWRDSWVRS